MKEKENALETIICGGTAGLVSRFFIAPLDVLKIRLQLQSSASSARLYTGIYQGFKTIIAQEGLPALWKGNVPAEILYVTYAASQFLAYKEFTELCQSQLPMSIPVASHAFIAGAGAGTVATIATYPFDLLRTRFAARRGRASLINKDGRQGVVATLRQVCTDEGLRGLYRGLGASIIQIIPYMGLLFGTYEPTRKLVRTARPSSIPDGYDSAIAGLVAGMVSKTGVFPLDLIRKRLQVQGPMRAAYGSIPVYASTRSCIVNVWRREGLKGFYKGLGVSLLKTAPSTAITLWTFDQSAKVLHHIERRWETRAAQ